MSSIISAKKYFVDPSQELSFLVEDIINSKEERIILVIPENSLIFSSIVSLKVLYRLLNKAKKLLIIVTEDKFGISAAQKVGYLVVNKLSQIDEELWDIAKNKQIDFLAKLERDFKDGNPIIKEESKDQEQEPEADLHLEFEESELLQTESNTNSEVAEEDVLEKSEFEKHTLEAVAEEDTDTSPVDVNKENKEEVDNEYASLGFKSIPTKKDNTKIVTKGNIKLLVGGDIRLVKKNDKIGDISNSTEDNDFMTNSNTRFTSFTGKDLTKDVIANKKDNFFSKLFKRKPKSSEEKLTNVSLGASTKGRYNKVKIGTAIVAIISIALVLGTYFAIKSMASASITVEFEKSDVNVSKTIQAKGLTDAEYQTAEIDFTNLIVPAKILSQSNLSASRSADATGVGKRGNKANGFIDIYNTKTQEISLAQGTLVTNTNTNKQYRLKSAITLTAAKVGSDSVTTPSVASDVPIEAVEVGPEYNIEDVEANKIFIVQGYENVDEVSGRLFSAVTGGSVQEFKTPSQQNVDALKAVIVPELEKQSVTKIKDLVQPGYYLIEQSIKFEETKQTILPEIGAEATNGTFTLTIEGKVTAMMISVDHLEEIVEYTIYAEQEQTQDDTNQEEDSSTTLEGLEKFVIENVSRADMNLTFTISTQGQISEVLTEEQIKNELKGKSIKEAENFFEDKDNVVDYTVKFSPSFAPSFLKKVPNDTGKITVRVK